MGAVHAERTTADVVEQADTKRDGRSDEHDRVHRRVAGASALTLSGAIAQAKLTVGPANDPYEAEADSVADRVVRALNAGGGSAQVQTDPESEPVARRVQRRATTIGAEGGAVDADTDREIRSKRGGGRAMPDDARRKMEGAFGADFGGVRIHEGSHAADLSNRIQAKAFTVGNDVFFRDGMPDTTSSEGQHLLAHELTHTIQQGGASAMRTGALVGKVRRRSATVQRKVGQALMPLGVYSVAADGKVDQSTVLLVLDPSKPIEVDDSVKKSGNQDVAGAAPGWVKVTSATDTSGTAVASGWLRESSLSYGTFTADGDDVVGDTTDTIDKVMSPFGEVGNFGEAYGSEGTDTLQGNTERNMSIASGAGDVAGSITGMASSISAYLNAEDGWERTEAGMGMAASVIGGAKGIAGLVKDGSGEAGKSKEAAGALSGFADVFEGIKATFMLVKNAVDMAKDYTKMTGTEKGKAVLGMITNALEAASSGVKAAKAFIDTFLGGASESLSNTVPGFGIALGVVDVIIRAVDLVKGLVQQSAMRADKRTYKDGTLKVPSGCGPHSGEAAVTGKKFKAAHYYKKLVKKQENGATLDAEQQAFMTWADSSPDSERFQGYLMSKGLQYINKKRSNRAVLKMSVAMGKIAGDAATLGGASAPVGVGIKAGAMALDVGASLFRKFKQFLRDKRAEKEKSGTGGTSGLWLMVDSKKSTPAKLKQYNKTVKRIFTMIAGLGTLSGQPQVAQAARIKKYLAAMGISQARVDALKDQPAELHKTMIKYLKERE